MTCNHSGTLPPHTKSADKPFPLLLGAHSAALSVLPKIFRSPTNHFGLLVSCAPAGMQICEWRGSVTHRQSFQTLVFVELARVLKFGGKGANALLTTNSRYSISNFRGTPLHLVRLLAIRFLWWAFFGETRGVIWLFFELVVGLIVF